MIDTGTGNRAAFQADTENFAKTFGFYVEQVTGTLDILKQVFDEAKNCTIKNGKEVM